MARLIWKGQSLPMTAHASRKVGGRYRITQQKDANYLVEHLTCLASGGWRGSLWEERKVGEAASLWDAVYLAQGDNDRQRAA
jgi:hypothetical protein